MKSGSLSVRTSLIACAYFTKAWNYAAADPREPASMSRNGALGRNFVDTVPCVFY